MSSRRSSSAGEGLSSNKYGERTPLRSLENDKLHLSAPSSRLKSSADSVKTTKGEVSVCDTDPVLHCPLSTNVLQTSAPSDGVTAVGPGDITFKSFVCPGGEVEISGSLICAEESIILPNDQATHDPTTEDTVISDSMIVHSSGDHIEHPYYSPEVMDVSSAGNDAARFCEIPNTTLSSGMDDEQATKESEVSQNDCSEEKDITWKSFVCDGGEVEVADVTRQHDETIPLPQAQLGESLQDNTVNSSHFFESDQLYQAEHADHPYSVNKVPVIATIETPEGVEKSPTGLSDVTFKSFNCTGGEIEISDDTKLVNDTVPLPDDYTFASSVSCNYSMNQSVFAGNDDVQNCNGHLDHPYCSGENYSSTSHTSGNISTAQDALSRSTDALDEVKQMRLEVAETQTGTNEYAAAEIEVEITNSSQMSEKIPPVSSDQTVDSQTLDDDKASSPVAQNRIQDDGEQPRSHVENDEVVLDDHTPALSTPPLTKVSLKTLHNESVNCQVQETSKHSEHPEDSESSLVLHKTESSECSKFVASAESPAPVEEQQHEQISEQISEDHPDNRPPEPSEGKDSALGSTENGPALYNSPENHNTENLSDVLKALSACPSVASALQFGILSPVVRRASLALLRAQNDPTALDEFLADDSALDGERSFVFPVNPNPAALWADHLESPMPRPLLNSTVLSHKPQSGPVTELDEDVNVKPCAAPQAAPEAEKTLISDGALQQQLRQMAEFLILACGKMGATQVSVPAPPPAVTVPPTRAAPAETRSVCVGNSPVKVVDRSLNTSGQFERKREFVVADSCTLTDPLLWNVPPGSLESLPRQELEQRLRSSMIMVEALVQQLSAARAHGSPPAGPAPSELREKMVQTDHTELSQTTMYRDLYMEALSRISELELDGNSLQNLIQCMKDMGVTMTSLRCDTDAALCKMKDIGDFVRDDHQSLVSHYGQMKSLCEKTKETQTRMMQKVKDALLQRNDMRTQMEEAVTAKEAAFDVMEQLRTHCATEMSTLEKCVGSQQELLAALNQAYPEQVALNQAYTDTLNSASDLLTQTMEEQSSLMKELCAVRSLVQKTAPMLLQLNEKAAAALRERDEHISAREQAVEEKEQIEGELNEANLNLQTAREQISDLNLQVTILTSEMGVLRQKLTEREEDRGQLERKVTELSATVSSTLASYTFLEQALAAETSKLQQSWNDIQQATDRANELETSLGQSEQRVAELSQALAQSQEQLSQLQTLSQSQKTQLQQLQDICTQLGGVREMNEFLQMENELAREQVAESERLLRANLQGLRERNIQCEDLKGELSQIQLENRSLQEQLETTRSRASVTQMELSEKLGQAVTEITLLHHTLRGLTNELHAALSDQEPESQKDKESQLVYNVERRHPSSSFVDSIIVALTTEKEEDVTETPTGSDEPESQSEALFSEASAFSRVAAFTPKKNLNAAEFEPEEDDQHSVAELLADLGTTVTELVDTVKLLQQRKDAQMRELHGTVHDLQEEQQAANIKHEAEVFELKHQLTRLNGLAERGNQALQQKAQDEKTLAKLSTDIQDAQEILNKHKTENNELRKEVVELRRSLQQSQVESHFLREELRKAGGQSAAPAHFMEEKIQLLREVERLKLSLQEVEQARVKILERAKRHQMIHQTNQLKSENELQILNNMIKKIRETLLSLPHVVKSCQQLQQLVDYIG